MTAAICEPTTRTEVHDNDDGEQLPDPLHVIALLSEDPMHLSVEGRFYEGGCGSTVGGTSITTTFDADAKAVSITRPDGVSISIGIKDGFPTRCMLPGIGETEICITSFEIDLEERTLHLRLDSHAHAWFWCTLSLSFCGRCHHYSRDRHN